MKALISDCLRYRYLLSRGDTDKPFLLWVMLNPSDADEVKNDPTTDTCWRITQAQGFEHMVLVNLYAYRTPYPTELFKAEDPVGADTDRWIYNAAARASKVICAWGNHAKRERAEEVKALLLNDNPQLWAVGINANGSPKHALYTATEVMLEPWPRSNGRRTKRVQIVKS